MQYVLVRGAAKKKKGIPIRPEPPAKESDYDKFKQRRRRPSRKSGGGSGRRFDPTTKEGMEEILREQEADRKRSVKRKGRIRGNKMDYVVVKSAKGKKSAVGYFYIAVSPKSNKRLYDRAVKGMGFDDYDDFVSETGVDLISEGIWATLGPEEGYQIPMSDLKKLPGPVQCFHLVHNKVFPEDVTAYKYNGTDQPTLRGKVLVDVEEIAEI